MNLAYLFLAESAVVQGGSFYAYGGGVHYLAAERFPSLNPSLALVASVRLDPEESQASHLFELRGFGPDGGEFCPVQTTRFEPKRDPEYQDLATYNVFTFNFKQMPFACPGPYEFQVSVDGNELGRVRLEVIPYAPKQPSSDLNESRS
jgi:hypothetical protein